MNKYEARACVWIILIIFVSTFTFCGDPDIHDGIVRQVNEYKR